MNRKKEHHDLHILDLPDHLLIGHILPRLPVKSLIRFKSVCKYWHTTISSPEFAECHLKFSSTRYQLLLHINDKEDFSALPYDEDNYMKRLVKLESTFPKKWERFHVVGCCNGLVCLSVYARTRGSFVLWNPAIHQCREIAHPHDYCNWATSSGFAHLSFDDDYSIISSFVCDDNKDEHRARRLYIFSLRSAKWKRIDESEWRMRILQFIDPVVCDDTMYFAVKDVVKLRPHVLGFNLISKQAKQLIEIPAGVFAYQLLAMEGSLMIYRSEEKDILVLKQQGDVCSWEKLVTFSTSSTLWSFKGLSLSGKCLVHYKNSQLKLIDPTHPSQEDVVPGEGGIFCGSIKAAWNHFDSLIWPSESSS